MKLLSAHIENFGALKNTDYTFSKGLNCICKENGAGKTTFAAFLPYICEGEITATLLTELTYKCKLCICIGYETVQRYNYRHTVEL